MNKRPTNVARVQPWLGAQVFAVAGCRRTEALSTRSMAGPLFPGGGKEALATATCCLQLPQLGFGHVDVAIREVIP